MRKEVVNCGDIHCFWIIGYLLHGNEVHGLLVTPGGGHHHGEDLGGDLLALLACQRHHQPLLGALQLELPGQLVGDEAAVGSCIPHDSCLDSGQFNLL